MNKTGNTSPRCELCIHRTLKHSLIIHEYVAGCDATKCEYVRKDDHGEEKGIYTREER